MGTSRVTISIAFLLIAGIGLYFILQDSSENPVQRKQVFSDSISAPDRPTFTAQKDTQDTMPQPPPVGEDCAPGTALIRATILSVEYADDQPGNIVVNVDEVMGYGPSTPPIPTGTELSFDISNLLQSNPDQKRIIQEKAEIKALIASQQGMKINQSDDGHSWAIIELKQ